jgi:hypothetical protein
VADLTGDGQPEIIINWGHLSKPFARTGACCGNTTRAITTNFRPSPVTVADVTGDGQMNIVTASPLAGFGF